MTETARTIVSPVADRETVNVDTAMKIAAVNRRTIMKWNSKYGLGWRLDATSPWRIDRQALVYAARGQIELLTSYIAARDREIARKIEALNSENISA